MKLLSGIDDLLWVLLYLQLLILIRKNETINSIFTGLLVGLVAFNFGHRIQLFTGTKSWAEYFVLEQITGNHSAFDGFTQIYDRYAKFISWIFANPWRSIFGRIPKRSPDIAAIIWRTKKPLWNGNIVNHSSVPVLSVHSMNNKERDKYPQMKAVW